MIDKDFKKQSKDNTLTRSQIKRWKKLYFKKERVETIDEFISRIKNYFLLIS